MLWIVCIVTALSMIVRVSVYTAAAGDDGGHDDDDEAAGDDEEPVSHAPIV